MAESTARVRPLKRRWARMVILTLAGLAATPVRPASLDGTLTEIEGQWSEVSADEGLIARSTDPKYIGVLNLGQSPRPANGERVRVIAVLHWRGPEPSLLLPEIGPPKPGLVSGYYFDWSKAKWSRVGAAVAVGQPAPGPENADAFSGPPLSLPPPATARPRSTAQLEIEANRILAADDVTIGRQVDLLFELVDRLVAAKRDKEALGYLAAGLQHDAWALDYQLLDARLLQAGGDATAVPRITSLVLQYGEKDAQINAARALRHEAPLSKVPAIAPITTQGLTFVLVPIGKVDVCVLDDLRQRLQQDLDVTVLVLDAGVVVPPYARDPAKLYLKAVRDRLDAALRQDTRLAAFLQRNGFTAERLKDDAGLVGACRCLAFASGGMKALDALDASMAKLQTFDKQWDLEPLLDNLTRAVAPYVKLNIRFLGVADFDVFARESNYQFDTAVWGGNCAIVSYRRFAADFTHETPNRRRLVDRAFKASVESLGFLLGIPRCSNPTCPRSYAHNLAELDATSLKLCDACAQGFRLAHQGNPATP